MGGAPQASRRIADDLKSQIEQGANYPPGTKLKSYRQLAAEYGVAHNTAQAAVRLLQAMGLVEIKAASGAYVRERMQGLSSTEELPQLRAELEQVREQFRQVRLSLAKAEQALEEVVDRLPPEIHAG
ncbi:winged helix-turn-helix domain-containing protein [Streptosporangium sp. NPDC000239]|uniref:GntR family transcriptional regulator n=1 Tax=Streptosporangium sp. NPDC000239 TaxID=3154248 RepID=UPI00332E033E